MPVNWGLAEPASGALDILRAAGQAQLEKLQTQNAQQAAVQQQQKFQQQQTALAARPAIQAKLTSGDYSGARQDAIGNGDFDFAEQIGGLSKEHRDQLDREADTLGRVSYNILNTTKEGSPERLAAVQAAAPQLQSLGIDASRLDPSHLTDGALTNYVGQAVSLKDQIAQHNADNEMGLKRDTLAETVNNHQLEHTDRVTGFGVTERGQNLSHADAAAGRAVTLRGQSLADARAHEANRIAAANGKPLTEAQGKATTYYMRAKQSESDLAAAVAPDKAGGKGAPPPGAGAQFADSLPLGVGSHLISDKDQQQLTARRGFIAAVLRQESGAAISDSEFASYNKLYFPQQGDKPTVIANKDRLRRQAVDGLRLEAGPGGGQADALPSMQPSGGHGAPASWKIERVK
jgi:hypothetical protein